MNPFLIDNTWLLLVLIIWVLPWKAYALWTAVKHNNKGWFLAILIFNTFGILEIIYIFAIAKKSFHQVKKTLINFLSPKK